MAAPSDPSQRIARLTPLRRVLSHITASVAPVAPVQINVSAALGRVAAEDVAVTRLVPSGSVAVRDGYAVSAQATADANAYAPVPLGDAQAVEVGEPLPPGTDAVAPPEAVLTGQSGAHAVGILAPGEGAVAAGTDLRPDQPLPLTGTQLRQVDLAVLTAADVGRIGVRAPRVRVIAARDDLVLRQIVALIERLVVLSGGDCMQMAAPDDLAAALASGAAQFIVVVGGSGVGRRDRSVATLAQVGRVAVHGVGVTPGETSALGAVGSAPVLVLPGRIDAALAAWLTVGAPIMNQLTGCIDDRPLIWVTLERKVASTVGLLEFVPVRLREGKALPLASGYLPLHALSQADGYILVPAESEGYPQDATVGVRLMP